MAKQQLRFKQILSGAWHSKDKALTYSLYGLAEDGSVWRAGRDGWTPEKMTSANRQPASIQDEEEPF